MPNLLEIDSVMKTYGDRRVLTDIYLKCQTGDIIGMLGRNGTGKSTLLKILFGAEKGDYKFVRIDGVVYNKPFKTPGIISYLPQHNFLPAHLTAYKIAELYLAAAQIVTFFDDALIGPLQKNKISELSGGELRYLEIKLLLNLPAKFVLLDEPFNGVAPVIVQQLKSMIIDCSKTKGIILTDHDYNNVLDVANRYCLVYDGGIKHIDTKEDLVRWQYLGANSLID
jgi:lipopolysaccharide export system ATP-binding protein